MTALPGASLAMERTQVSWATGRLAAQKTDVFGVLFKRQVGLEDHAFRTTAERYSISRRCLTTRVMAVKLETWIGENETENRAGRCLWARQSRNAARANVQLNIDIPPRLMAA